MRMERSNVKAVVSRVRENTSGEKLDKTRIKETITVVFFFFIIYCTLLFLPLSYTQTNKQYNISIYTKYKL